MHLEDNISMLRNLDNVFVFIPIPVMVTAVIATVVVQFAPDHMAEVTVQCSAIEAKPLCVSPFCSACAVSNEINLLSWDVEAVAHLVQIRRVGGRAATRTATGKARLVVCDSAARVALDKL